MNALLRFLACVALLALLPACSSGFERKWNAAAKVAPTRADPFSGRWEGRWESQAHRGHGGRLRCIFTRAGERRYRAQFHANWMIFASGHTATFDTTRHGDELRFRGQHDLGPLFGGVYRYAGHAIPTRFWSAYESGYDRGTFLMARPQH